MTPQVRPVSVDSPETNEQELARPGTASRRHNTTARVVLLLEALALQDKGVSVREFSRETGIDKSAVSRLFDQMCEFEIAERDQASGRFRAGSRFFALAAAVRERDTLWHAAEPILSQLAAQFNETCYLAVRERGEVVFREKIDCTHTLRYVIPAGERIALHAGAGGRAVLLGLPPTELDEVLERMELRQVTARTIVDRNVLRQQVEEDREKGYALSMGERRVDACAIAAPYFAADGECRGSIVYTCPTQRFDVQKVAEIGTAVVSASRDLSLRLGFHVEADSNH